MDRDSWSIIQGVLVEAVELPVDEQEAFVRSKLPDRPDLVDEVLSLLKAPREIPSAIKDHPIYSLISAPEITSGMRIKQYVVQEKIGKGGMGVVYKALDTRLGRPVALKFLPAHLYRDKKAKQRFELEARTASSLNHSNICTIYDIDEFEDGHMFIAMACYEGETLKEKIKSTPLGEDEAVDVIAQTAKGLYRAHQNGIIHRDIKPGNLMITNEGEVKILDFGIVKVPDLSLTVSGHIIGTAYYMSPERFSGALVDHRADIWSLGIVLYEALTGDKLFDGEFEEAVIQQIQHIEPDLSALNTGSPEIKLIVKKCIAKKPDDRFLDALEVAEALERAQRHKRQSRPIPSRKPIMRRGVGILMFMVIVGGATVLLQGRGWFSSSQSLTDQEVAHLDTRPVPEAMISSIPAEVRSIINARTGEELDAYINKYYTEKIFQFAPSPEEFDDPSVCYILFYDDRGVVAVLSPEEDGARFDLIKEEWVAPPYMDKYESAVKLAFQF